MFARKSGLIIGHHQLMNQQDAQQTPEYFPLYKLRNIRLKL